MKHILFTLSLIAVFSCAPESQQLGILVGTYTENSTSVGVYLYSFDPETANCTLRGIAPAGNPSFVISSPAGKVAYAVNEFNDGRQGVSSFILEDGAVTLMEHVTIPKELVDGEDPCNILYAGDAIVTSNYTGGTVTAFSLTEDGHIGELIQQYGREGAHMHCAVFSPDGKYIFVTDLGNDCIYRFQTDEMGPLSSPATVWQNEDALHFGPRHMIFSADGRFAYLLCELADKLVVFSYDDGLLTPVQILTAYDGDGHGSADLHLSPDGRFLYTSHRLKEDGIAIFSVDNLNGTVSPEGYRPTGIHPRNFAISPDGRFLLCACRDSDRIEIYSIDSDSGALTLTDKHIEVGAPVCVQFLPRVLVKFFI